MWVSFLQPLGLSGFLHGLRSSPQRSEVALSHSLAYTVPDELFFLPNQKSMLMIRAHFIKHIGFICTYGGKHFNLIAI